MDWTWLIIYATSITRKGSIRNTLSATMSNVMFAVLKVGRRFALPGSSWLYLFTTSSPNQVLTRAKGSGQSKQQVQLGARKAKRRGRRAEPRKVCCIVLEKVSSYCLLYCRISIA